MKTEHTPWTRPVPPQEARGDLAALYERIRAASSRGAVSELWQVCGHDPRGLGAIHTLYRTLMDDPAPLTRAQAERLTQARRPDLLAPGSGFPPENRCKKDSSDG